MRVLMALPRRRVFFCFMRAWEVIQDTKLRGDIERDDPVGECIGQRGLARFVVDIVSQLDISGIHTKYAERGGMPLAPEVPLGLLFYGYVEGVFSSRKVERAIHESIPFRFVVGGLHPDHGTIPNFLKNFLAEIQEWFVQVLLLA